MAGVILKTRHAGLQTVTGVNLKTRHTGLQTVTGVNLKTRHAGLQTVLSGASRAADPTVEVLA